MLRVCSFRLCAHKYSFHARITSQAAAAAITSWANVRLRLKKNALYTPAHFHTYTLMAHIYTIAPTTTTKSERRTTEICRRCRVVLRHNCAHLKVAHYFEAIERASVCANCTTEKSSSTQRAPAVENNVCRRLFNWSFAGIRRRRSALHET